MPLLRFDVIEGRSEAELKALLDAAHRAMLAAFGVPERDRYQIVTEHKRADMIIEDTGLGFARSDKLVVVQVTTRKRKKKMKEALEHDPGDEADRGIAEIDDEGGVGDGGQHQRGVPERYVEPEECAGGKRQHGGPADLAAARNVHQRDQRKCEQEAPECGRLRPEFRQSQSYRREADRHRSAQHHQRSDPHACGPKRCGGNGQAGNPMRARIPAGLTPSVRSAASVSERSRFA
jgi:hypothetical protein